MDVMHSRVSKGTKGSYCRSNSQFISWIFFGADENVKQRTLAPWFLNRLREVEEEQERRTANMRNPGSEEARRKRMHRAITSESRTAVEAVNCQDDNCPILLQNLTFQIFSSYLVSKHEASRTGGGGQQEDGEEEGPGRPQYMSNSTYETARSAIVYLHKEAGAEIDSELRQRLCDFMSGMRRKVATQRKENGVSIMEGKRKMSFQVYEKLCELLLRSEKNEFAHCFLVLEWNLMARSQNVVDSHVENVYFDNDCLVFQFGKTKCDQTGKNSDQLWHVYANPHNPAICPVLSLARYLFANPGVLIDGVIDGLNDRRDEEGAGEQDVEEVQPEVAPGNRRRERSKRGLLFPGGNQYKRFMSAFHNIIKENADELARLGVEPGDLGSHSARKGACSFASAGCTVSPPMASICLRACWSMGPVKERYLHYEKAGDQFLGRAVSGLNMMTTDFAVSPPHFDATAEVNEEIDRFVKDCTVGGSNIPSKTFVLLRQCVASLVFHHDFLSTHLHPACKLRSSPLFTAIPPAVKNATVIRYPWERATPNTPTFSGLPPHVVLMSQMKELRTSFENEMRDMREQVRHDMVEEFDQRRFGTDGFFETQRVIQKMEELHGNMLTSINDRMAQGIAGVAVDAGAAMGGGEVSGNELFWRDEEDLPELEMEGGEGEAPVGGEEAPVVHREYSLHWRGSRIGRTPEGFVMPSMTLSGLITCWFLGNREEKIVPFRFLKATDMTGEKKKIKRFYQT